LGGAGRVLKPTENPEGNDVIRKNRLYAATVSMETLRRFPHLLNSCSTVQKKKKKNKKEERSGDGSSETLFRFMDNAAGPLKTRSAIFADVREPRLARRRQGKWWHAKRAGPGWGVGGGTDSAQFR